MDFDFFFLLYLGLHSRGDLGGVLLGIRIFFFLYVGLHSRGIWEVYCGLGGGSSARDCSVAERSTGSYGKGIYR